MTVPREGWLRIRNWRRFQHYDPKSRAPRWIKNYTALLHDDDYLALTDAQRALLHGLWLWYAERLSPESPEGTWVRHSLKMINRSLGLSVKIATLEALNDAGFLEVSASKPLAERYQDASLEVESLLEAVDVDENGPQPIRSKPDHADQEKQEQEPDLAEPKIRGLLRSVSDSIRSPD